MILPTIILIIIVLLAVIYQDLKFRTNHIVLPVSIFILSIGYNFFSLILDLSTMLLNIGFVLVNVIGVILYFSIKNKAFVNPIDNLIGLGDICFFIAITPLFNLRAYIIYFIAALVISLVMHLILNQIKKIKSIPLAGYMSMVLIPFLVVRDVLNINIV